MPGGAAQFLLAPKKNVYKISDGVELKTAVLIEPLSCAVRGFDQLPRVPGTTYLIYGAGTMGLMMAELARINGAASVSIVDTNPEKLLTAELLNFELNFDPNFEWTHLASQAPLALIRSLKCHPMTILELNTQYYLVPRRDH